MSGAENDSCPNVGWTSDRTLLISIGSTVDEATRVRVERAAALIARLPALIDVTRAYASVQATFDAMRLAAERGIVERIEREASEALRLVMDDDDIPLRPPPRTVEIPVCYDATVDEHGGCFAPDLEEVAQVTACAAKEVISLHSGATYRVHFLGFTPGFAYMSGLPEALHLPRRASPRARVPAGSVAIAGAQAGVYPSSTPGGWHILGRTPLRMFDITRDVPALLRAGDIVRFVPITRADFDALARGRGA